MNATARDDLIPVYSYDTDDSGVSWLVLDIPKSQPTYEDVVKFPSVLEFKDDIYVRTGWNSDIGKVFYRNKTTTATDLCVNAIKNVSAMMDSPVGRRKYHPEFETDALDFVKKALAAIGTEE